MSKDIVERINEHARSGPAILREAAAEITYLRTALRKLASAAAPDYIPAVELMLSHEGAAADRRWESWHAFRVAAADAARLALSPPTNETEHE